MSETTFEEFGLIIIESLRDNDKKTGQILHNEVIKYKKFEEPNLTSSLHVISTKKELFDLLSSLIDKARTGSYFPFIHFEVHGFSGGIELTSKELVHWQELIPYLRTLNIYLENYLVVMMAACEGNNINIQIDPFDRAPFRAVIGTFRVVTWADLLKGFEAFYSSYFFELDPFTAVEQMNAAVDDKCTFGVMPSEIFFDKVLDPDRDPEFFAKMILETAIFKKLVDPAFKEIPLYEARAYFDLKIREDMERTKKNRDYFTMKDLRKKPK